MIVPALLTDKREDLERMLYACEGFAECVQVDVMDGKFVPSRSIGLKDLEGLHFAGESEAHLMVQDPASWLEVFKQFGSSRVIYHYEIDVDHRSVIETIKAEGFAAGLAINPGTDIEDFEHLIDELDSVLFLSVNPGFYGAPFIPAVLEKVRRFKDAYPHVLTGIDGGIKLDNVEQVWETGVDYVCVGSAILKANDPGKAFQEFKGKIGC